MYNQMPCLQSHRGLEVLPRTADQRFKLDPETFLHTHMPMTMWMDREINGVVRQETIMEHELLKEIMRVEGVPYGNRIYVLYGSTGSGKSELSKWLETSICTQDPSREDVTIRISRTELDIVKIAGRFKAKLSGADFKESTHANWRRYAEKSGQLASFLLTNALFTFEQLNDKAFAKASLVGFQ